MEVEGATRESGALDQAIERRSCVSLLVEDLRGGFEDEPARALATGCRWHVLDSSERGCEEDCHLLSTVEKQCAIRERIGVPEAF
jgi:hypothetical protein